MKPISILVELPDTQAWPLAQFLKRVCLDDYRQRAADDAEAWAMLQAGEKVRAALAEAGYAPR